MGKGETYTAKDSASVVLCDADGNMVENLHPTNYVFASPATIVQRRGKFYFRTGAQDGDQWYRETTEAMAQSKPFINLDIEHPPQIVVSPADPRRGPEPIFGMQAPVYPAVPRREGIKIRPLTLKDALGEEPEVKSVDAQDILAEAQSCLRARGEKYNKDNSKGGRERHMQEITTLFNQLTGHELKTRDGWLFMVCLKMVRAYANGGHDCYVDGAAYFALAGEIEEEKK